MTWFSNIYKYIWYYSEWWITETHLRRPWTFAMRDKPWIFWYILTPFIGLMAYLGPWMAWRIFCAIVWGMIVAHLWWGSKHTVGEQEQPTFDPLHPRRSIRAIEQGD